MPRWRLGALFALLLTAASPPLGEGQHALPERAVAVLGQAVIDPSGKEIGRLVDVLVGNQGEPEAAVIDVGGFMGVGSRKIAVQWSALHFTPGDIKHPITLDLSLDQLKDAPEYKSVAAPTPVVVAPAPSR